MSRKLLRAELRRTRSLPPGLYPADHEEARPDAEKTPAQWRQAQKRRTEEVAATPATRFSWTRSEAGQTARQTGLVLKECLRSTG